MIQIQLMFKTAEEAIVALAKLSDGKAAAIVAATPATRPVEIQVPVVEKKERKPRSDKDKKREPYGPRTEQNAAAPEVHSGAATDTAPPAASPAGTVAPDAVAPNTAAPDAGVSLAPSSATVAAAAPDAAVSYPTEADAQKAMEALFAAKQLPGAMAVLSGFKVNRVRDLKPEQRKDFIDLANAAAAR